MRNNVAVNQKLVISVPSRQFRRGNKGLPTRFLMHPMEPERWTTEVLHETSKYQSPSRRFRNSSS